MAPRHGQPAPQELPPRVAQMSGSLLERRWGEEKQPSLAGPTARHGNVAEPDLPAQLTLQRKVTA